MPTVSTPSHETEMSSMATIHYSSFLNAAKNAVATVFAPSNGLYFSLAPETSDMTLHL
jgi:hypothetical protein